MVQNTVGRIYLDNNPYETTLQKKWRYLVNQTEKPTPENLLKYNELTDPEGCRFGTAVLDTF